MNSLRPRPGGPRRPPRSRCRPRRRPRSRSRPRPARRSASASATTSIVWRVFSATSSSEPSKSTEFQPVRRQVEIHSRSGQWSRCRVTGTGDLVGPGAPHRVEGLGADRLHGLQRRLDDQRRLELGRRREHGLERQVVDDVDRRHAVALRERAVEDLTHRHDRHGPALLLRWGTGAATRHVRPDRAPTLTGKTVGNQEWTTGAAQDLVARPSEQALREGMYSVGTLPAGLALAAWLRPRRARRAGSAPRSAPR